jgi:molybdopterin-binding protein
MIHTNFSKRFQSRLLRKRSAEELNFNLGKKIYASFKATAVHVIK